MCRNFRRFIQLERKAKLKSKNKTYFKTFKETEEKRI